MNCRIMKMRHGVCRNCDRLAQRVAELEKRLAAALARIEDLEKQLAAAREDSLPLQVAAPPLSPPRLIIEPEKIAGERPSRQSASAERKVPVPKATRPPTCAHR